MNASTGITHERNQMYVLVQRQNGPEIVICDLAVLRIEIVINKWRGPTKELDMIGVGGR